MVSILIVEDNEELLELVAGYFKNKGSFDVFTASDGTGALKLVDERDFDIAILDILPSQTTILRYWAISLSWHQSRMSSVLR